jgi:hypothetical protein
MTGTVKMLIWDLKNKAIRNLLLPSPSQRMSFPVAIEAEPCSEQNKTLIAELTSVASMYAEIAKQTK